VKLRGHDIICFAGEDWWFHNPHSNLHLMREFAKQNRVLFVNSPGIRMPRLLGDRFAWRRLFGKLKSLAKFVRLAEENIWVFTPIAIPMISGYGRSVSWINERLLVWQLKLVMATLQFRCTILWVTVVVAKDAALRLKRKLGGYLVYYCVDNVPAFPGVDGSYMLELEDELHRTADIAFYVNHALLKQNLLRNPLTFYTGHGVDYTHFAVAQTVSLPVPVDMESIINASGGQVAGYMGEVNSVDIGLIGFLANENPNISFVFIGEICESVEVLKSFPNVHFLGQKSYRELPAYLQFFAVCCLFYKTQSAFNNYRNPKKLLEYLATGKPVVSVAILELEYFSQYISIAQSYSEFELLLRRAIAEDSPIDRQRRIEFAEKQTWDAVAEGIASKFPPRLLEGGTDGVQAGAGVSKAETRAFPIRQ